MDVRAHVSMIFHLDKCIGCHTCSVACKNVRTDRPGAEYMWWNNVETKPGTGYPTHWENQKKFNGGWKWNGNGSLNLRCQNKADAFLKLFYNPNQPNLDDYYEPWTYKYDELFTAKASDDQPTAVPDAMKVSDRALVESQRNVILDPNDPKVVAAALKNGISEEFLTAAQHSPAYKYLIQWKLALPLHIEYRTLPMLFYVPPLLPVMGKAVNGTYEHQTPDFFAGLQQARLPIKYLAALFSAGNEEIIEAVLKKLMAVRHYKRWQSVRDRPENEVRKILREARTTPEEVEEIYQMTAIPTQYQRYVLPPLQREEAVQNSCSPEICKGCSGFSLNPALAPRV